jgi:hypothetical protein
MPLFLTVMGLRTVCKRADRSASVDERSLKVEVWGRRPRQQRCGTAYGLLPAACMTPPRNMGFSSSCMPHGCL